MNEANNPLNVPAGADWRERGVAREDHGNNAALPSVVDELKRALQRDQDLAWAWHCNIAMPIHDSAPAWISLRAANDCAARVMEHLFGVDITKNHNWGTRGFVQNGEGCP